MARSFYDDNKRVRNERIKRELGVAAGLSRLSRRACAAILKDEAANAEIVDGARCSRARSASRESRWSPSSISVDDDLASGKTFRQAERRPIGHIGIAPCRAADRTGQERAIGRAQDQMPAPFLDQRAGEGDRLVLIGGIMDDLALRPSVGGAARRRCRAQISSSVKSGAPAMPIRPATRCRPGKRRQQAIQQPMLEPTRICGPLGHLVENGERIVASSARWCRRGNRPRMRHGRNSRNAGTAPALAAGNGPRARSPWCPSCRSGSRTGTAIPGGVALDSRR